MSSPKAILDPLSPLSPLSVPPSQTAVLLLDYHAMLFLRISAADGERVIKAAQTLASWGRSNGALIVHGLIDVEGPIFETCKSRERMEGVKQMVANHKDAGAEIEGLAPPPSSSTTTESNSLEVTLHRTLGIFSALKSRGITELLQKHQIKSLVIGGISTSGCVLRTSLAAADDGFITTIVEDACADPLPEIHEAVVNKIVVANVHVVGSGEWVGSWSK